MPSPAGSPLGSPLPCVDVGLKGGIITGGLGRPACQGMIINTPFQLACFVFIPPEPAKPTNDGGSIPLEPGEIQDFYQPVDLPSEGDFVDPSVYGKRVVKVIVRSKFLESEKEFMITEKQMKNIFKVANIVNVTKERMNVVFKGIRNIASRAVVTIKNLRLKR